MDTERLYGVSDEAKAKVEVIDKAFNDALYQIELIAHDLQSRFGVSDIDHRRFLDAASEHLQDMLSDIREGYVEETHEADDEISNIEYAALERQRPVL
jgi:hypothetical protein